MPLEAVLTHGPERGVYVGVGNIHCGPNCIETNENLASLQAV